MPCRPKPRRLERHSTWLRRASSPTNLWSALLSWTTAVVFRKAKSAGKSCNQRQTPKKEEGESGGLLRYNFAAGWRLGPLPTTAATCSIASPMSRLVTKSVEEVLKASPHPLTLERLLEEIHDRGHRSTTKQQVSEFLTYASSNGRVRLVPIPGRSSSGWEFTESYKRQLGLLAPSRPATEATRPAATVTPCQTRPIQTRGRILGRSH